MVSSQLLLVNSGLTVILALRELMLPPRGPRLSLGFIYLFGYASCYFGGVLIDYGI
jgi:hypothetical protein